MELLEGETLADHVERYGPVSPARGVHIVGQAARALAEAHSKGIIHRDIKPENLFLTSLGGERDFVKVLDFGIAKIAQEAGVTITRTGWLLGTPLYMSPEAVSGKTIDARSDVYALGAVLYFLLCGKPPFETENPSALVFAQVHHTPALPSKRLGKPIPSDLEKVVMRALRKDPQDRYASASDFALALSTCSVARASAAPESVPSRPAGTRSGTRERIVASTPASVAPPEAIRSR
jgi:serine/threonine-protein kinase